MKHVNHVRSIKLFLRPKNKQNKQENFSIYLRVNFVVKGQKDQFELSSEQGVKTRKEWNEHAMLVKGNSDAARRINTKVKKVVDTIETVWESISVREDFSKPLFQAEIYRLLGIEKKAFESFTTISTISDLFDHCLKIKETGIGENRKKRYRLVKSRVEEFLLDRHQKTNMTFHILNRIFYYDFKSYIASKHRLEKTTLEGYMRVLKAVVNEAKLSELIDKNPFEGCKSEVFKGKPRSLKWDDYVIIEDYPDDELDRDLLEVKLCFLVLCNTGQSYGDFLEMTKAIELIGDDYFIIGERLKTKVDFDIYVRQNVVEILQRLCRLQRVSNFQNLQFMSLYTFNKKLKVLAAKCNLKVNLSSHIGRHTYATLYIRNGGTTQGLADNLGHCNLNQTRQYGRNNRESILNEGKMVERNLNKRKGDLHKFPLNMN